MQSHSLWDTDMRPHGFGSGSRKWRPVSGLGRLGVRTKSGTNNTAFVPGRWKEGRKSTTRKRRGLMCGEVVVGRGGVPGGNSIREVVLRGAGQTMWFGGKEHLTWQWETVDRGTGHNDNDVAGSVWPQWGNIPSPEGAWGWATSQWATPPSALAYTLYFKEGSIYQLPKMHILYIQIQIITCWWTVWLHSAFKCHAHLQSGFQICSFLIVFFFFFTFFWHSFVSLLAFASWQYLNTVCCSVFMISTEHTNRQTTTGER